MFYIINNNKKWCKMQHVSAFYFFKEIFLQIINNTDVDNFSF